MHPTQGTPPEWLNSERKISSDSKHHIGEHFLQDQLCHFPLLPPLKVQNLSEQLLHSDNDLFLHNGELNGIESLHIGLNGFCGLLTLLKKSFLSKTPPSHLNLPCLLNQS
jgi:hypothetical protein